jgi:uncharacterized protein (TIGR00369 family)
VSPEKYQQQLATMRTREHGECIVCGLSNAASLRVEYRVSGDGCVSARIPCSRLLQGYRGQLHGGIISSLLDGAMTHCLFARGKSAVTGELNVRFLHPVVTEKYLNVTAWLKSSHAKLHKLEANLMQDGRLMARASAKFMERSTRIP